MSRIQADTGTDHALFMHLHASIHKSIRITRQLRLEIWVELHAMPRNARLTIARVIEFNSKFIQI